MENLEKQNQEKEEKNSESVCEYCGRPIQKKQTIGFGQINKTETCTCSPFARTCSKNFGFGK